MVENGLWEKDYELRLSDFDKFNHIKMSTILDLFLDATEQHNEALGVGYDSLIAQSYFWALVRIKFQIISQPKRNQKVIVKTWPRIILGIQYRREYSLEDQEGKLLVVGSSEWVIVQEKGRRHRLVTDLKIYRMSYNSFLSISYEPNLERLPEFNTRRLPYMTTLGFCDLTAKNQVNNTIYANFVMDSLALDGSEEIATFQIDYRSKAKPGPLTIYYKNKNEFILAKGQNELGETIFICQLKYKE